MHYLWLVDTMSMCAFVSLCIVLDDHHCWGRAWAVWHCAAQHAKRAVYVTCVHVLSRMWWARVVLYAEKCVKGFVWSDQQEKLTYVKAKDGNTDKGAQEWKGLLVCCGVLLIQTVWLCHIADLASSPCFQLTPKTNQLLVGQKLIGEWVYNWSLLSGLCIYILS